MTRNDPRPSGTDAGVTTLSRAQALALRLSAVRSRTWDLVAPVAPEDLDRVRDPLMSPLSWDLGHIAAYEDLWLCHRAGGLPLLRDDLADVYDAFETPRAVRGDQPYLRHGDARAYMDQVRGRSLSILSTLDDTFLAELVAEHELQHQETMLQALQLAPAGAYHPPAIVAEPRQVGGDGVVELEGGQVELGAPREGFAYDNERPAHTAEIEPCALGAWPVTCGAWAAWIADGGYARRKWWSEAGWAWRNAEHARRPRYWTADGKVRWFDRVEPIDDARPVLNVSFWEAEAFARAHGARLPREAEWEAARRADLLEGVGAGWEWTQTPFDGYAGFRAHPYREYSEVFFGDRYRVLRGGSFATHPTVARPTFRNWDLPQRRQIFTTVRLAFDA